jgi:hypothetical protein
MITQVYVRAASRNDLFEISLALDIAIIIERWNTTADSFVHRRNFGSARLISNKSFREAARTYTCVIMNRLPSIPSRRIEVVFALLKTDASKKHGDRLDIFLLRRPAGLQRQAISESHIRLQILTAILNAMQWSEV